MSDDRRTLADLLPQAAARRPDGVAVVDRERQLTYAELDARVQRLAAVLVGTGVGPGDLVAIHLPKSLEAIVAIHAVHRAGAAYVPLDPSAPASRSRACVDDADPKAAIVERRSARMWDDWRDAGLAVPPTIDALAGADSDATAMPAGSSSTDLAYVLYTSGSTGRPKGVEIEHANALAFVDWGVETFALGADDRLSSHAPLHFDLSIFDVFGAAAAAATLVLVPKVVSTFPVELAQWIDAERITVWYSVPTVLTLLVTRGQVHTVDLSALRVALFAGEVLPVRHLATLMELVPGAQMWNLYGPTETNVCTAHRVADRPDPDGPPIPIGRAVAGDRAIVMDDDGEVAQRGAIGELVVTGPTVARGYRNAPEATRERFSTIDGDRAYRTGDRVYADADGVLHFVGRADHQIKTRGHRVELGEIETALRRHGDVADAVVIAVPDDEITNRLVGFVQPAPGRTVTARDVASHLAGLVPSAMVPDRIEVLDQLPKTSTGKIDRLALAAELTPDADPVPRSSNRD